MMTAIRRRMHAVQRKCSKVTEWLER